MIKAEYIWLDGTRPTAEIRSKTRVLPDPKTEVVYGHNIMEALPIGEWGFDGSSTNQAEGHASDCVLKPIFSCADPIRKNNNILVLCEVFNIDDTPHLSNSRVMCRLTEDEYRHHDCWFGLEQEYTLLTTDGRPHGFELARQNNNEILAQGPYYCAIGAGLAIGRKVAEEHLDACLTAGLKISGINAEVMPGQWEFQIGPAPPAEASDHLILARWLLHRIAEDHGLVVSFDGKPTTGDWNGAGCHTNFSTALMRSSYEACINACEALGAGDRPAFHINNYGHNIQNRLTGAHETCSYQEFRYGVSDRGASIRIPWQVYRDQKGYIEDRRPNANCDPYVVTTLLTDTICATEKISS
tara:strand:+ start:145 stop:1209 length:1065 start_codon:yes stop_codon:yes gene_type:complete